VQDPDPFLRKIDARFPCIVDPRRPAQLDADHRVRLNYELFYFADAEGRAAFEADPTRYCGILTDPVSRVRFRPGSRSPRATYENRVYYFASDTALVRFQGNPKAFESPVRPRPTS